MITLRVTEENPISIKFVEAKVKPETECNVTPEPNSQTILPTPGTTFGQVNVSPIPSEYIIPTGIKNISTNGLHNVAAYEQVNVDVHEVPIKGAMLSEFDTDGFPLKLETFGLTALSNNYLTYGTNYTPPALLAKLTNVILNDGITSIGAQALAGLVNLNTINIPSSVNTIEGYAFRGSTINSVIINSQGTRWFYSFFGARVRRFIFNANITNLQSLLTSASPVVELYDFSHNTQVCPLNSAGDLPHASDCIVRVPTSLLSEWENSNIWSTFSDVIWEGV